MNQLMIGKLDPNTLAWFFWKVQYSKHEAGIQDFTDSAFY